MENQSNFTQQQVTDAIRAGLREGRQPVGLSTSEAEQQSAVYRRNLSHYRQHVQKSLDEGDYLQVAEKSWGAYAQTIKAIAADHGLRVTHHASIIGVAGRLASLAAQADADAAALLDSGLNTARSLHTHFYEDDLPQQQVINASVLVSETIDHLPELFPPEPSNS